MEIEIRYVRSAGVAIAYQVVGAAELDLVYVPDYMSNLVYGWEHQYLRRWYERLARSFRLILFDKRGTGLSDHGPRFAALETRIEDLRAIRTERRGSGDRTHGEWLLSADSRAGTPNRHRFGSEAP
jgi:hypothetical protein